MHHAQKEFLSYLQVSEPQTEGTAAKVRRAADWRVEVRATVDNMVGLSFDYDFGLLNPPCVDNRSEKMPFCATAQKIRIYSTGAN